MKLPEDAAATSGRDRSGYPWLLLVPFLLVLALNLIGRQFPSVHTWGFNVWSGFSPWYFAGSVVALAILSVPKVAESVYNGLERLVFGGYALRGTSRTLLVALVSALLFAILVFSRSDAPMYGDGYTVVANSALSVFAPPAGFHEVIKFLPVVLYRVGNAVFAAKMHMEPRLAFGVVSCIGGLFGFWGLWRLARALGRHGREALPLMAAGLAGGCTVLFFGHLELYTWGIAVLLWFLASTVEYVGGRGSVGIVWVWLVISGAMQILFGPTLIVAALALMSQKRDSEGSIQSLPLGLTPRALAWGLVFSSLAVGLLLTLVPTAFSFTPLWEQSSNPYSAFSSAHLVDVGNLIFLAAPLILLAQLLHVLGIRRSERVSLTFAEKLLGVCSLSLFLVSFWLDPGLGATRDWDLLSLFGIPASVFAGVLLIRCFGGDRSRALITSLSLGLVVLVPMAHVVERTNGERAVTRLDAMVWQDPHYQSSYKSAQAALPWGSLLQTFTKQPGLAEKYLQRKIAADPSSDMTLFNLGEAELAQRHYDSAVTIFAKAYRLMPESDVCLARYAQALQAAGRKDQLQALLPKLVNLESDNMKALGCAGFVLVNEGKVAEAIPLLKKAYHLRPWDAQMCNTIGLSHLQIAQYDSAQLYFRTALPNLPASDRQNAFRNLIECEVKTGELAAARASLAEYRQKYPDDQSIQNIQSLLDRPQ